MEALSAWNEGAKIADETVAYYLPMTERSGTIWEMDYEYSSRNHGFQSHICCNLIKYLLGLELTDPLNKVVSVKFYDLPLGWCERNIPVAEGMISLKCRIENGRKFYQLNAPAGYSVNIENYGSLKTERVP